MVGRGNDLWLDKSFNYTVYDNAYGGFHTEHSGLDGMVSSSTMIINETTLL